MELNEALDTFKSIGAEVIDESTIGKGVDVNTFNSRLQRLDAGWHFIDEKCNPTARVFVIGKEGVGFFRFSVRLSRISNPEGNDRLEVTLRLLGYVKEGSRKNLDNICNMLFKEDMMAAADLKLGESIAILEKAGAKVQLMEDTDEYDDADLGLNVNPKEYHKQKAKMTSLKNRNIGTNEAPNGHKEEDDDFDDDAYDVFSKPTPYKISDSAAICKNPTFKKRYQKELLALFDSSKTPDEFFEKCTKVYEKYNDLYDELDDKIVDMEDDGKKVPEDLKYKKNFYDAMGNALSEWDFGNWPGDMVLKCNDMALARQMIVHLFENDFSLESAMEVYNKLKTRR